MVFPKRREEEEEDGEEFEAAEEHPKGGEEFGEGGEEGERFGGAGGAEGAADVVEEAGDEAEGGFGIDAVENEGDGAEDGEEGDDAKEGENGEGVFVVDLIFADVKFADAVGSEERFETVEKDFVGDVKAGGLDPAGCRARHAADEHEDEHEHLRGKGPKVVVGGVEAGSGLHGEGLETAEAEGLPNAEFGNEEGGDDETSEGRGAEKEKKVGDIDAEELKAKDVKKEGEVDAPEDHKGDDDPFGRGVMKAGDAVVAHGKAAGRNGGEGGAEGFEKGHVGSGPDEKGDL